MTMAERAARGQPLRFLAILLAIWIASRAFYGGWPSVSILPSQIAESEIVSSQNSLPLGKSGSPESDIFDQGTELAIADLQPVFSAFPNFKASQQSAPSLPQAILAEHQLAFWDYLRFAPLAPASPPSAFAEPSMHSKPAKFRLDQMDARMAALRSIARPDRLSLDSWAFARPGSSVSPIGGRSQYGGSQAGAILRYMLGNGAASAPMLFMRATRAFAGPAQPELAFGISARPALDIPVRIAAEQRVALDDSGFSRPALYAVTELSPIGLPEGASLSTYGQVGLIGIEAPAYFFDLQMVAQKPIVQNKDHTVSLGAGLWSGGQGPVDDAGGSGIASVARLDVGPRAALNLSVAGQPAQLAVDWRQRVAGNADPGSGPALTLSTRF
ncbi:MAG: hypothetical protein AAGH53_13670 [Pseudomonadota bacterium]